MNLDIAEGLRHLPLDTVTQAIGILAKRRSGKSYCARRLAEQLLHTGLQTVIVDPKGDWWGIRSSSDGKHPGLPVVIIGGERGDVPLEPGSGDVVARLVVEDRVNVLLDLSLLRKGEIATFMTAFLEGVYRMKAKEQYRTPMMLIIDEADAIAPQKPFRGEERMLGAAEDIVRRGGQRGIGCTLVTQRSAVLNKNVLTQVQILIALRTIAPQDLAAMDAWIDVHGTPEQRRMLMESLPSLPTGDAWFWSPGWPDTQGIFDRAHVKPITTFDSGATPKAGEKREQPRNIADVDLDVLKRQMSATIERAKAEDPKELRKTIAAQAKEIAELKRAKPAPEGKPSAEALKAEFDRGVKAAKREMAKSWRANVRAMSDAARPIRKAIGVCFDALQDTDLAVQGIDEVAFPELDAIEVQPEPVHLPRPSQPQRGTVARPGRVPLITLAVLNEQTNGDIPPVGRRIMNNVAELHALGIDRPLRLQVAVLSGYTNVKSDGYLKAISYLRTNGFVSYPDSDTIALTDAGREQAADPGEPLTSEELQQRLMELVEPKARHALSILINRYPKAMPREELARMLGYSNMKSDGFVKAISRLRSMGLMDYPSTTEAIAASALFLESR